MSDFAVVLFDSGAAVDITADVSGLSFRSSDPGGFASVTFDLDSQRHLSRGAYVGVYDGESAEQVGGGRLLTLSAGSDRRRRISVLGEGFAHTQELKEPYMLIESSYEPWYQGYSNTGAIKWSTGGHPIQENISGLRCDLSGTSIPIGKVASAYYYDLAQYGQKLGGYRFNHKDSYDSARNRVQALVRYPNESVAVITDEAWHVNTSGGAPKVRGEVGSGWTAASGANRLIIRYERTTSTLTTTGDDWSIIYGLVVQAVRLDRNGVEVTGAASSYGYGSVSAHDAVIDAWARFCPNFDLVDARIDDTSDAEHYDLAFPEGITVHGFMDKLTEADPYFTWAVWERLPGGKFRPEWRERDLSVRYELSAAADGFEEPDVSAPRLDAVYVTAEKNTGQYVLFRYYADHISSPAEVRRSTVVKYESPASIDLYGDYYVKKLAKAVLEESARKSTSATATVTRKVRDRYTGRWVTHVLPGYLCRVAGADQSDSSILTIVSTDYSADAGELKLELNAPELTTSRAVANLLKNR